MKLMKYVGGKSNVLDQVMARMFPEEVQYNRYVEPMCGSAVVGLHVADLGRTTQVCLADSNLRLVTMLRVVRDHPAVLATVASGMAQQYDSAGEAKQQVYYRWRNELNSQCSEVKTAALMLLLNRTCFPPGVSILRGDGTEVPIETCQVGDVLWGGRVVKEVLTRPYNGQMLGIKAEGAPGVSRMTADHPVLRIPKSSRKLGQFSPAELEAMAELVPAHALEVGDMLLIPGTPSTLEQVPMNWSQFDPMQMDVGPQAHDVQFNLQDEGALGRLIGYYAANGNTWHRGGGSTGRLGGVTICFNRKNARAIEDCCAGFSQVFGVCPKLVYERGNVTINVSSSRVACTIHALVPGKTWSKDPLQRQTKQLHPRLSGAPVELQREVLKGWLLGDGGFRHRGGLRVEVVGVCTIHRLAKQMYGLARRCGFRPTWRVSYPNGAPMYNISFANAKDVAALGYPVEHAHTSKARRRVAGPYVTARVTEVTRVEYCGLVHNVEVDGDHLICVDSVVSHNCFNGLWRVNAKGQYNVSWGQRETCSYNVIHTAIFEASKALQGVQIAGGDFARVYTPEFGDLWYFDPPYDGVFDSYGSWTGENDLRRLAKFSREAVKKGAKVFISNSDTPLVRQVFEGCVLHAVEGRTCVSQTTEGRGMTKELLVEVRA